MGHHVCDKQFLDAERSLNVTTHCTQIYAVGIGLSLDICQ